ncbi:MAG: transposase [Thiotrichaceae bacterium]|nr:transposase [Thiotrichaceae bacterium]
MARPLRIEYENAFYHVMNRGRGRQGIYTADEYYHAFLKCLKEAHQLFGLEIHAYCLMGNHYHLLVKTPWGNLSRAMRHINGVYTQRHNRLKKTNGSLFRGRYKAILVDEHSISNATQPLYTSQPHRTTYITRQTASRLPMVKLPGIHQPTEVARMAKSRNRIRRIRHGTALSIISQLCRNESR